MNSIDNLIALRIFKMLITPFDKTDAYKLGIIDAKGKVLKSPETSEEKDAYTYLSRLVFNVKRMLNKLPGGESKLKNILAAAFLVKENLKLDLEDEYILESKLNKIIESNIILAEEYIQYNLFLEDEGGVPTTTPPTNRVGPMTSTTDTPVYRKKKPAIIKRQSLNQVAVDIVPKTL